MKKIIISGFIFSIILAFFISPFASTFPDGLEKFAENHKFLENSEGKELFKAPIPDYEVPFITNSILKGSIAGLIGVLFVYGIMYGFGKILLVKKTK